MSTWKTWQGGSYCIGVMAEVIRVIELGDNNYSIIVQAKQRFEWLEITQVSHTATYKIHEVNPGTEGR